MSVPKEKKKQLSFRKHREKIFIKLRSGYNHLTPIHCTQYLATATKEMHQQIYSRILIYTCTVCVLFT